MPKKKSNLFYACPCCAEMREKFKPHKCIASTGKRGRPKKKPKEDTETQDREAIHHSRAALLREYGYR